MPRYYSNSKIFLLKNFEKLNCIQWPFMLSSRFLLLICILLRNYEVGQNYCFSRAMVPQKTKSNSNSAAISGFLLLKYYKWINSCWKTNETFFFLFLRNGQESDLTQSPVMRCREAVLTNYCIYMNTVRARRKTMRLG